jgi:hypothetical protein
VMDLIHPQDVTQRLDEFMQRDRSLES